VLTIPASIDSPDAARSVDNSGMPFDDPVAMFSELFEHVRQLGVDEPNAMVLSTVDESGRPSGRYVLLKEVDQRGFVFYTNLGSRKARALSAHPYAALCFYWAPLGKQVRVEGNVEGVSDEDADAYFATRPREFQISAWASKQSATLASRESLDRRVQDACERFEGLTVPRPPFWSGFRVVPTSIELWTRHPTRLHERILFEREDGQWVRTLLFP
jgi:pyridoxamine 5'-phosphate oxidase